MPKVSEMFAFVVSDSGPDDEGVVAFRGPGGVWMPMIGADMARVDDLRPIAAGVASELGQPIRLLHFRGPPAVIETINPVQPPKEAQ